MVKQRNVAVQILVLFSYKIDKSRPYTTDILFFIENMVVENMIFGLGALFLST